MQLELPYLSAYLRLQQPALTEDALNEKVARLRSRLESGQASARNMFIEVSESGEALACCRLARVEDEFHVLAELRRPPGSMAGSALIAEAMARAGELRLKKVVTRPSEGQLDPEYRGALVTAGFRCKGSRIEYKTALDELPTDESSPLTWSHAGLLGKEIILDLLERISVGTPFGLEKGETAEEVYASWFSDDALYRELDCIQVGLLEGQPVALACAQSETGTGWGTLSLMGLAAEARGRGLGSAVQRHGMNALRAQGATVYHGGTAAENEAMLAVFKRNGCREYRRMSDWIWRAKEPG